MVTAFAILAMFKDHEVLLEDLCTYLSVGDALKLIRIRIKLVDLFSSFDPVELNNYLI